MKKALLATAIAAFVGFCGARDFAELKAGMETNSAAMRIAFKKSMTTEEWKTVADQFIDQYQANKRVYMALWNPISAIGNDWDFPQAKVLAGEYDQKFYDVGIKVSPVFYKLLPKSAEAWLLSPSNAQWAAAHPATVAAIRKSKNGCFWLSQSDTVPLAEQLNSYVETYAAQTHTSKVAFVIWNDMPKMKKYILSRVPQIVREELRKQGKPIVVKDGVNLVQDTVDELLAAIDAPKFAGVKEWCAKWCSSYAWIDPEWMPDEYMLQLKDDLFYGRKDFTPLMKSKMLAWLGVTEYNKFVEAYNN